MGMSGPTCAHDRLIALVWMQLPQNGPNAGAAMEHCDVADVAPARRRSVRFRFKGALMRQMIPWLFASFVLVNVISGYVNAAVVDTHSNVLRPLDHQRGTDEPQAPPGHHLHHIR